MILSDISIRRPVLATVMSLIIILLGLVGYRSLSVREYPNIDEPTVSVTTTYSGASAQIMESQVTKPLEDSLSGIEGIKYMTSTSREGASLITINFNLSRDADSAAADVRDKVARVRDQLPDDVDEPIINKVEADNSPIIYLVLNSDTLSAAQLSDLADRYVQDKIQTVDGVAEADILGARTYAMRIWLDPVRMAAYDLTPADVETVLQKQNVDIPSGRIQGAGREYIVESNTDVNTAEAFRNLIVATRGGTQVRLGDVASVNVGVEDDTTSFRYNGKQTVALGVVKQSTANPLDISTAINAAMPDIQAGLPPGVNIEVAYDSSVFIRSSIDNVYETLLEAIALVALVVLLFLRSVRAMMIPLVAVPVSLIGTFFLMKMFGFTINTLTLLAMVLAIGLVVDDAIVMLENIFRHIEEGMKPINAALKGSAEIAFPVIAMTLTLAAVYVPIAFMEGRTGKLFTEFALSLAASVMISGFVALTLSPMLCGRLLNRHVGHGPLAQRIENGIKAVERGYMRGLRRVLEMRWLVFPVMALLALAIWFSFSQLKSELSPIEDRGVVLAAIVGPEGATSDYMNAYAKRLEGIIEHTPAVQSFGYVMGLGSGHLPLSNQGFGFIRLADWGKRKLDSQQIAGMLFPQFMGIPGFLAIPITPQSLGARGNAKPVDVVIEDTRDYPQIGADLEKLMAKLHQNPGLVGLDSDLKINTPQVNIHLDREKMADLGISPYDAGHAVELLLAARQVGTFKYEGEQYNVILQANDDQRVDNADLASVQLRTASGAMVPLADVATLTNSVAPRDLNRFNRVRSVEVTSNLAPDYALGDALKAVQQAVKETFPATTHIDYSGQTREYLESSNAMYTTFGLAVLFIFLVLAAQFESFVDPVIILFTVPLTMLGALLALWITGNTLNIYSQIGLVTLVGLITKHGILLVEFANEAEVHEGLSKLEAIRRAAELRLRPILMTTAAMVLGALPLAIAHGAGAESRHQLGWVIVGGMSLGTLMTLFVLPCVYTYLHRSPAVDEHGVPLRKKKVKESQPA